MNYDKQEELAEIVSGSLAGTVAYERIDMGLDYKTRKHTIIYIRKS